MIEPTATVDVVLPTLNEEAAMSWVLSRMPKGYRPIVVDNGSTDRSVAVANEFGAVVVTENRRGFGAACFTGLKAATAEVVAFMDCDASLDPMQLPLVAQPVLDGRVDLTLGARCAERGAWPAHARIANRWLARHVRSITGWKVTDLGPMRAAHRDALLALGMQDRRSGWPLEMVLRAGRAGWSAEEVEVTYRRRAGRSKVTGTARGTLAAIRDMRRELRRLSVE